MHLDTFESNNINIWAYSIYKYTLCYEELSKHLLKELVLILRATLRGDFLDKHMFSI